MIVLKDMERTKPYTIRLASANASAFNLAAQTTHLLSPGLFEARGSTRRFRPRQSRESLTTLLRIAKQDSIPLLSSQDA